MDLPPDKAKLLKQYDNEKKWDIICDQVSISVTFLNLQEKRHDRLRYYKQLYRHFIQIKGFPIRLICFEIEKKH